jgi:hypothetical protein
VTPTTRADALFLFMEPTASCEPAEQYVLFELRLSEARYNSYGDLRLPSAAAGRPPL